MTDSTPVRRVEDLLMQKVVARLIECVYTAQSDGVPPPRPAFGSD